MSKITSEGIAVIGLVSIAILALVQATEPETIVIAIAAGLVGYIKGTSSGNTP